MTSYTNASKNASTYSNTTEWESTILTFLATEDNEIMTSEAEEWLEIENTKEPTDYNYRGVSASTYSNGYKASASYSDVSKNTSSYSNISK